MEGLNPTREWGQIAPHSALWKRILRVLGAITFVTSFFLPAVAIFTGFSCALISLASLRGGDPKISPLAFFGGLLNFELILFFLLAIRKKAPGTRAFLAVVILLSLPVTWIAIFRMSLAGMDMDIRVGHVLWVVATLLIVLPDVREHFRFRAVRWLAAAGAVPVGWFFVPVLIGLTMHPAAPKDDFFYVIGSRFASPQACGRIGPNAIGREDHRDSSEYTYLRSDCYRNIAVTAQAPWICKFVKSAGADRLFGSWEAQKDCRKQRYSIGTSLPVNGTEFVQFVRATGFTDEQLAVSLAQRDPGKYIEPILAGFRHDPDFLKRLQNSPGFDEAEPAGQWRPAKPLELLDQTVAVESDMPSLCEKISPQAAESNPSGNPFSLRGWCFSSIAFNRRDPALCQKLNPASASRPVEKTANRESCLKNVEVLRRPSANLGWAHYGPAARLGWAQFVAAMHQLGYQDGPARLQLPKPSDGEFLDFVISLGHPNDWDHAQRDAFLRGALAMR